jgi:hypothetical protein
MTLPPFAGHRAPRVAEFGGVGWVLDPNRDWHASQPAPEFAPRPAFHLSAPYIKALNDGGAGASSSSAVERDRKRRRKWEQHPDATDAGLVDALSGAHAALLELPSCKRFFASEGAERRDCCSRVQVSAQDALTPSDGLVPCASPGQHAAHWGGSAARTCPLVCPEPLVLEPAASDHDEANAEKDLFTQLRVGRLVVVGSGAHHARLALAGETYVVPPDSAFFLGDAAQGLRNLCSLHMRYELLVLDPPWPSKSRGKHYRSMSVSDLSALPVGQLLQLGGLLALWVTNDRKLVDASRTRILEAWGLEAVATWYWLKVTCHGQLCSPLESPHKKPFERTCFSLSLSLSLFLSVPTSLTMCVCVCVCVYVCVYVCMYIYI